MLSIKPVGSSKQEVNYYADLGEDYYVDGGEPPGRWWGDGAEALGLSGIVQPMAFRNLLAGKSADGQTALVQNAGRENRRAAFDLTFSVPKSVSITRAIADDEMARQIDRACNTASRKVFDAVQQLCGFTRRGGAGRLTEPAKLVAAVFRHETARGLQDNVPDPNLHYHMVLCNVAVREDGTTATFHGRTLFRPQMKMALGALFRTELSKQLEEIGLATSRAETDCGRKASWFELESVPAKVIEAFSKRRKQIVEWLKEHGQTGAKAAERAALSTRQVKSCFSRESLSTAWKSVAARLGLTPEKLQRRNLTIFPHDSDSEAKLAVERGLKQLTNDRGHFTETELLRYAAQEGQCRRVGIDQVFAAVRTTLQSETEIVRLQIVNGERRFTTPEILQLEQKIFHAAEASRADDRTVAENAAIAEVLKQHPTLRPEQAEAVRHITAKPGRIQCVNGMAGTGKTFMLGVARDVWTATGLEVVGTALAAKAAQGLQEGSGIESTHVHRLLWELQNEKRTLTDRTVLVVDEAGMIGTRMMAELVSLTEKSNSKLVLVGDHRQLQAIDFGAPFRGLAERIGVAELREITRQRERWARTAVSELASGQAKSALEKFAARGLLRISDDRDRSIARLVDDWKSEYEKGSDTRIFAGTRMETATVNRMCQQVLLKDGTLREQSISVGRHEIHIGDRVVVTRNNSALMVRNGTQGTVVGIDARRNELQLSIENGLTVRIDIDSFPHIDLGYCTTTHKGQGQTVESAFVLVGGSMTDRELSYVQSSRARGTTRLYADKINGGASVQKLAEQMARSRSKDLVHDYLIEAA